MTLAQAVVSLGRLAATAALVVVPAKYGTVPEGQTERESGFSKYRPVAGGGQPDLCLRIAIMRGLVF